MSDKITIDRAVLEQALNALEMMGVPSPLVFLPDEIKSWQTVQAELSAALDDQFNPDWDRVEALQETLREHMAEIHRLRAALEQPQVEQEPDAFYEWWRMRPSLTRLQAWLLWKDEHPQPPRQPLTDAQINDHRLALAYDSEDLPDPWDFKQGVRAAERAHGIGGEK